MKLTNIIQEIREKHVKNIHKMQLNFPDIKKLTDIIVGHSLRIFQKSDFSEIEM